MNAVGKRFLEDACREARKWAMNYDSLSETWDVCPNPLWMLWALDKLKYDNAIALRRFACWCLRETPLADGRKVWDLLTDKRSRKAVKIAEAFCEGKATQEELTAAGHAAGAAVRDAAGNAARAAVRDAAGNAARAAAWDAAQDADWAAAWDAAQDAAGHAAWNAARAAMRDAAGKAARGEARDAAGHAAWNAARDAQANALRTFVENPFKEREPK